LAPEEENDPVIEEADLEESPEKLLQDILNGPSPIQKVS